MDKKIVFFELPNDVVHQINQIEVDGSRSDLVAEMLQRQLSADISTMNSSNIISSEQQMIQRKPGEIQLLDHQGKPLGTFDVNSVEEFHHLAKVIGSLSDDPLVRMKARKWR